MPRKARGAVAGKNWQYYAEMDTDTFNTLSVDERKAIIDKMAHTVNARVNRFIKVDEITPAVRELIDSGDRITARGKDEKGLATEFSRAKRFLNRKTSSRSGWSETKNHIKESLKEQGIVIRTNKQFREFWKIYNELSENDPIFEDRKTRYHIMEVIAREVRKRKKLTQDEILQIAKDRLHELYRAQKDAEREADAQAKEGGNT